MTSFVVNPGITQGTSYDFKVKARNKWGWGDFSSTVTIAATGVPDQMSEATTTIDIATGGVKITWTQPDNNGATISSYLIEI